MQDFAESSFLIISYSIHSFGRSGLCSESLQPQTDGQEKMVRKGRYICLSPNQTGAAVVRLACSNNELLGCLRAGDSKLQFYGHGLSTLAVD